MSTVTPDHDKPVNLDAARILWRAPWWAHLQSEEKQQIIRAPSPPEVRAIDLFREPPQRPGGYDSQIKDLRGIKIQLKTGEVGVVTGYAGTLFDKHSGGRIRVKVARCFRGGFSDGEERVRTTRNLQSWWVLLCGRYTTVKSGKANFKEVGKYTPLTIESKGTFRERRAKRLLADGK